MGGGPVDGTLQRCCSQVTQALVSAEAAARSMAAAAAASAPASEGDLLPVMQPPVPTARGSPAHGPAHNLNTTSSSNNNYTDDASVCHASDEADSSDILPSRRRGSGSVPAVRTVGDDTDGDIDDIDDYDNASTSSSGMSMIVPRVSRVKYPDGPAGDMPHPRTPSGVSSPHPTATVTPRTHRQSSPLDATRHFTTAVRVPVDGGRAGPSGGGSSAARRPSPSVRSMAGKHGSAMPGKATRQGQGTTTGTSTPYAQPVAPGRSVTPSRVFVRASDGHGAVGEHGPAGGTGNNHRANVSVVSADGCTTAAGVAAKSPLRTYGRAVAGLPVGVTPPRARRSLSLGGIDPVRPSSGDDGSKAAAAGMQAFRSPAPGGGGDAVPGGSAVRRGSLTPSPAMRRQMPLPRIVTPSSGRR